MTPQMKWLALGALVVLWIGLVYVYVIDVPSPVEVPLKYQSGLTVARSAPTHEAEMWDVKSLKVQARELPVTPKRNIFGAVGIAGVSGPHVTRAAQHKTPSRPTATVPAASSPPPPPTPEELARQQEMLAAQVAQQQEQLRRRQLQEQMGQYRYLRYVNQNGVQKAFLGKGREIYILREGEILEGKFQVALIEAMTMKLLDTDSKFETTLKLKKDEPSLSGT